MDEAAGPNGLTRLGQVVDELNPLPQDKSFPIVLVPGFSGWGPPLLGAVNYWGGVEDIPNRLRVLGYTVIIATIAPLSSNWERACELYAQLREGKFSTVDNETGEVVEVLDLDIKYGTFFGNDHNMPPYSETSGRRRAILLPADGWKDMKWKWGPDNQAHFICHSQGGNTVRQLINLMQKGAGGRHNDYFPDTEKNRDKWVISISTLGTPFKGTTITDVIHDLLAKSGDEKKKLVGRLFATLSFRKPTERAFDLQLDHWGISRPQGKTFAEVRADFERLDGPVARWLDSGRTAFHDNSIEGVQKLHENAGSLSEHICYLTFSFHCCEPFPPWPSWAPQALSNFPISIIEIFQEFLKSVPLGSTFNWVIDRFRESLTSVVLWPIVKRLVTFHKFFEWLTSEVGDRFLEDQDFKLSLPGPGKKEIIGNNSVEWLLNDGVVNTISMRGPRGEDVIREVESDGFPLAESSAADVRGKYWHFGTTDYLDHADEIGVWITEETGQDLKTMFENLAALVTRIPVT